MSLTLWKDAIKAATLDFTDDPTTNVKLLLHASEQVLKSDRSYFVRFKDGQVLLQLSTCQSATRLNPAWVEKFFQEGPDFFGRVITDVGILAKCYSDSQASEALVAARITGLTGPIGLMMFFFSKAPRPGSIDFDGLQIVASFVSALEKLNCHDQDLHRTRLQAAAQELMTRAILGSLQDGVIVANRTGRFVIFNSSAERILGRRLGPDMTYGNYYQFFEEDEVTPVPRERLPIARAIGGEILHRVPLYVKAPGSELGTHISISGGPIRRADGELDGAAVSFVDMTGLLQAHRKLAEQQKMLSYASRMSAVGELAGAVAHEVNTPLAAISLMTESLRDQLESLPFEMPAKLSESVETIARLTDRIAKIVKSLRAVCRSGQEDPFVFTPIRRILSDTEELCAEKLKILGIRLSVQSGVDEGFGIDCRAVQIVQVLLNLLNNACDAIKVLDSKWVEIRVEQVDEWIEIKVTDSGPGVPAHIVPKLFSPLFSTKASGEGSGIGLSISLSIVESHHGFIEVNRSHPNTQFVVRLPVLQREMVQTFS